MKALSKKQRILMEHAIGVGPHLDKRNWGFRNYFYGSPSKCSEWMELVKSGYAITRRNGADCWLYFVTESGVKSLALKPYWEIRALNKLKRNGELPTTPPSNPQDLS